MFLISWVTALLTFGVIFFLYMVVSYHRPGKVIITLKAPDLISTTFPNSLFQDVNWGTSTQAQTYKAALNSVQHLNNVDEHVKNYRPQILVLSGMPCYRPSLVDFAYLITKQLSLIVCGQIVKVGKILKFFYKSRTTNAFDFLFVQVSLNNRQRAALREKAQNWFEAQRIKAFYCLMDDIDFEEGARALLQAYGVGKLRPNILMMGFKEDWASCEDEDLNQYFNVLQ